MIYLDYNATTPVRPEAKKAMLEALECAGNPSAIHALGRKARSLVEGTRELLATSLDADVEQIIFTSSGTEANNQAIFGMQSANTKYFFSGVEHTSVLACVPEATIVPVNVDGQIDTDALAYELSVVGKDTPKMVSVTLANYENGVIQPINKVVEVAKSHNAIVHCDAIQAYGKISFTIKQLEVDLLTVSAHKIGGPKGVGALLLHPNMQIQPIILGGGQEHNHRAGTENVPGIAGFGAAIEAMGSTPWLESEKLRDSMESRIVEKVPAAQIYGKSSPRLPNTSYIGMPGVSNQTQVMYFDLEGIAVSAGAACSSGTVNKSHVLTAMGISDEEATEGIRISLGWGTTEDEVNTFARSWLKLYERKHGEKFSD